MAPIYSAFDVPPVSRAFSFLILSANKKKTPGPKQSNITEMPVAMPQKVPTGAQQSSRRRTMTWLGTAMMSSRMLPRRSQLLLR